MGFAHMVCRCDGSLAFNCRTCGFQYTTRTAQSPGVPGKQGACIEVAWVIVQSNFGAPHNASCLSRMAVQGFADGVV